MAHETGLQLLQHKDLMPLWCSLAPGACLGGNGPVIGASANEIFVGMPEKDGQRIFFLKFMVCGMPVLITTVIISTIYVRLRYYLFS